MAQITSIDRLSDSFFSMTPTTVKGFVQRVQNFIFFTFTLFIKCDEMFVVIAKKFSPAAVYFYQ